MEHSVVRKQITKENIKRKNQVDAVMKALFTTATLISASFIVIIVIFIVYSGVTPFIKYYVLENVNGEITWEGRVNLINFLTGLSWEPPSILGVGFIVINTLYVSLLSLLLALPIGTLTALFIAKIAPKKLANFLRTAVELLASVPSIIYGVFGAGVIVYFTKSIAGIFGIVNSGGGLSVLSTVILLTMMILPTITTVAEVSIRSVRSDIEQGSLALGATKTQTNFKVVLTSAKSGIFTGAILGIGRALGEATAVSMVAGNIGYGPTLSFFAKTRTLTSTMLAGFHESTGLMYDIRFSIGIVLMIVIIITNYILNLVKKRLGNLDD